MAENTNQDKIEQTLEQALEQPNPLDALDSDETNVVEVSEDSQYKLANGNIITGKDLSNLQKGFTQSTQKYSQQIKELQELLEGQQKEAVALREYISAYATQTPTTSQNQPQYQPQDQGYTPTNEDYSAYYNQTPANPAVSPIDPSKLVEIIEARVLQTMKQERVATEKRLRDEAQLRAKEEAWEKKMPGIPLKEFVYRAQAAVETSDYDALLDEHLKLNKIIRAMEEKNRKSRDEQARQAYLSSPTSAGSRGSTLNNNSNQRLTQNTMRERIKQASAKAKEDIEKLGSY